MKLKGFSLCIVHHGEHIPSRDSYVPLRYGRLAEDLTASGADVVRVSPAFNHQARDWNVNCPESSEGRHVLVPTTSYSASFSMDRAKFLKDFVSGSREYLQQHAEDFDAILVGVPPPGMVSAVTRSLGDHVQVVADIRDIWPEALAVNRLRRLHGLAKVGGRLLSRELLRADAVSAVTPAMALWAPRSIEVEMLPLGMDSRPLDASLQPENDKAVQACFLSSHIHGYDFLPLVEGWARYCGEHPGKSPRLTMIGVDVPPEIQLRAKELGVFLEAPGRIPSGEVHRLLCEFDVGVAPATEEWGHSLGNKIFDYLAAGLMVLHTLEPSTGSVIDQHGFGVRVEPTKQSWYEAFTQAHSDRNSLRSSRAVRVDDSLAQFGREVTTGRFLSLLRPGL